MILQSMRGATSLLLAACLASACASPDSSPQPDERVLVRTADELPRRSYSVRGPAVEFLRDDSRVLPLADALLTDALADLEKYRIDNGNALKERYLAIYQAHLARGDAQSALAYAERARALESKAVARHSLGPSLRARIAAEKAAGTRDADDPRFREAFRARLRDEYAAIPPDVARTMLATIQRGGAAITPQSVEAVIASTMDPQLSAAGGEITVEVARSLLDLRDALVFRAKIAPIAAEVAGEVLYGLGANAEPQDLWTPRTIALEASEQASPTVIAIWDTGIDASLYPRNMWTNPLERRNGVDDDGNGFIDDRHGISFSGGALPIEGELASLRALTTDRARALELFAGQLEAVAGIDSPRARDYMSRVAAIEPAEQELLLSDLERMFFYVHGTHVAGVAVEGNPFVRVLSIADSSMGAGVADLSDPVAYGRKWADFCARNIAYLKRANVRVVNMSWGNSPRDCRSLLEAWNIGASPEERRRLGREMYLAMREGLEAAIRSAPEMLFITVAGNNNEDVDFVELIPAGLRIPNMVTLGAVDSADRLTSFTNTGESVELFANGDLVESFLPGGARVKWSGTSLSGPQLANLAAKMLALRPELKPTEIMDLVRANADPLPEDPGRSIINPKRTIEALRRGAFVRSFACVGSIALRLSSGTSPRWRTP
jgi:hypothetical protein